MLKPLIIAAIAATLLVGCGKPWGDTTNAPTAGKEYYVNKDGATCTVDTAAGTNMLHGPFATRDDAKRAKDAEAACKV